MAIEVTSYTCPSCGAPLRFDEAEQTLVCDYCESHFTAAEIEALYRAKDEAAAEAAQQQTARPADDVWDESALSSEWGQDAAGLRVYECPSCGGSIFCDQSTGATSCPYCGNPTVIPGQFSDALKPDYIIPFAISRESALEALKKHYGGKKLLPRVFSAENHIQEVKGIYVPFWLFDGEFDGDYSCTAERIHRNLTYDYAETTIETFSVERAGTLTFSKVPVDASRKMDDALMDSLEPYDYSKLQPFSTGFLPGFLAERYSDSVKDCSARADRRARTTAEGRFYSAVSSSYDNVSIRQSHLDMKRGKVHYALLPVWLLNTQWNKQTYTFAMNGQTGKFVGDLPMDKSLYLKYRLLYGSIIGCVIFGAIQLMTLFM